MATQDIHELIGDYDVFLGGIGPSIEVQNLSEDEITLIEKFFNEANRALSRTSPYVADAFVKQKDLIYTFAQIFKAKVNGKSFAGEVPSPGSLGIAMLMPFDLHYTDTPSGTAPAYTSYGKYDWTLSTTAGTAVYLLGDATNYFKMNPTVGKRAMAIVIKDGVIEVGDSPKFYQFKLDTERNTYPPFRTHVLADVSTDPDRPVYVHKIPFAIPLWYDFGIKFQAVPHFTGTADLRLVGVVFYEYDYYSQPVTG